MRITGDTPLDELYHSDDILSEDELMHWKYIKREKVNGKWRYWYDYKSLKKDVKSSLNKLTTRTTKLVSSGKKTLNKRVGTTIKSTVTKISNDVKSIIKNVKRRVYKYIAKVPTDGDTYRYFYSEKAYQAYLKGKNAVDKALDKNLNVTPSDTAKANAKVFTMNALFSGFGKAVYSVAAPALVALQVELTTPKSFSELKKTKTEQTNDEHQKAINPKYDLSTHDYSMNCSFCTAAYDLRKRGYDVEANPISQVEAYTVDDVCSWYKGAQSVSKFTVESYYGSRITKRSEAMTESEMLIKALKSNGDGARGHLALYWKYGGGHDVIWEVENGEVVIRDCQNGRIVDVTEYLDCSSSYDYVRIDNLEPTEEVLRTVRNRKSR